MNSILSEVFRDISEDKKFFMNHGHLELDDQAESERNNDFLKMERSFFSNSDVPARLYFYLCDTFEPGFEGKDVIEVSCGRGGGAHFIAKNYPVKSYIGLDISKDLIESCKKSHKLDSLSFVEGDAHKLPFADNSADIVINVQAIHYYTDPKAFMKEVQRVLRPGGHLIFTGFMPTVFKHITKIGDDLDIISHIDITKNILKALDATHNIKMAVIKESRVPKAAHRLVRDIFVVKGSKRYNKFKKGQLVYTHTVAQKV